MFYGAGLAELEVLELLLVVEFEAVLGLLALVAGGVSPGVVGGDAFLLLLELLQVVL